MKNHRLPKAATKSNSALTKASTPGPAQSRFPAWLIALLLVLVTIVLYWPVTRHDFVNYDDGYYVMDNIHVTGGLTLENARWAFRSGYACNWHPVTWLSHMADCQMFGLNPSGHHLTSVLLHALNAALVFALLQQMTGAMWRSLIVAALFAVHPLRVESVAWVAERKDVLSGFFGLLSLLFYARYVRKRTSTIDHRSWSYGHYWLSLLFLALGLMSKPMLVTWPFVMLLLDYWPLERFNKSSVWGLVTEKIPFFAVATAASVVTFLVQKHGGAMVAIENMPLGARFENALISYCRYLMKMFWPTDLAVFYPHPGYWPMEKVLLAGVLISGISLLLFVQRRLYLYLLMGWLWFVGTLAPAIGLVQSGGQAMADRYTYIPSLGVFVIAIWGAYELTRRWHYGVIALSVAAWAIIVFCIGLTRQQLGYWKDGEALFRHALEVTENNPLARYNLGKALNEKGHYDEAISQYQEAIRIKPNYAEAQNNLGYAFLSKGQIDEAVLHVQEALRLKPDFAEAHYNLGIVLGLKGHYDEAISQYQEAIRLKPDDSHAHNNLGTILEMKGRTDEAINQFREIIRLKPDDAYAHSNLGIALAKKGQINEAINHLQEALRLKPDYTDASNNLVLVLELKNVQTGH